MTTEVSWLVTPEPHDYDSAASYLTLLFYPPQVNDYVTQLRSAGIAYFKAKDLVRSANLPLLTETNAHVLKDLKKIQSGRPLSPILVLRGNGNLGVPSMIADGYHRICAAHEFNEDVNIPCKIVDLSPFRP
jgi:hypothetical protein